MAEVAHSVDAAAENPLIKEAVDAGGSCAPGREFAPDDGRRPADRQLSIELAARDYLPEEEGNTLPAGTEQHHGRRTMSRLEWGVKLGGPKLRQARRHGVASNNARADEAKC